MVTIRYADDVLIGFQHEGEARAFLQDLQERMGKFDLALHPTKTRLIRFGRYAITERERLGLGKPETFDFLGFTHFCTKSRMFRHRAQDDQEAHAGQTSGHQDGIASTDA